MPTLAGIYTRNIRPWLNHWSFTGVFVGLLLFALAFSPSLVPRPYFLQGILSGLMFAIGYGLGVSSVWLWRFLELPELQKRFHSKAKAICLIIAAGTLTFFFVNTLSWENSVRALMEMPTVEDAHYVQTVLIAALTALVLITFVRLLIRGGTSSARFMHRFIPRRISYLVGTFVFIVVLFNIINGTLVSWIITGIDKTYAALDVTDPESALPPLEATRSGSPESLIAWDKLGKAGKEFVAFGPRRADITQFSRSAAKEPIRAYVALLSTPSPEAQAVLALEELLRTDAFSREILVIVTPTGTGWVDPGAIDSLEYLHDGDTATVAVQYSYLQSPLSLLLEPSRSRDSARTVFKTIYDYWRELPHDERPRLYLHGISLGSYASETSAQLYELIEDPIHGALWAGPPFQNELWPEIIENRNEDSTAWLPRFEDGSLVRVTGRDSTLEEQGDTWGPIRVVYMVQSSDAIVFFEESMWWRAPEWLKGERGPDVSPLLTWYPLITFFQVATDMMISLNVPVGYGHNYDPQTYIDAWLSLTEPAGWTDENIERLKERLSFTDKPR